jgi:hypothetical protein
MVVALTADVLQDEIAVSLARAMAGANKRAHELGIDVMQTLITITQRSLNDEFVWRINYGPKDYRGRRGDDLIIEVDSGNASIRQVLWGQ